MTQHQETIPSRHRVTSYLLTGLGLTLALSIFHGSEWRGGAQLHTLMEIIATLLAVFIGAMALVRFYSKKNDTFRINPGKYMVFFTVCHTVLG